MNASKGESLTPGQELASVLIYYGMIDHVESRVEKIVCWARLRWKAASGVGSAERVSRSSGMT